MCAYVLPAIHTVDPVKAQFVEAHATSIAGKDPSTQIEGIYPKPRSTRNHNYDSCRI